MGFATGFASLDVSLDALREVAAAVPADAWDRPTPCARWNVAQVLRHAAGDQLGFAAFLTGGQGPDFDPFDPSGEGGADVPALVERAVAASAEAWAAVDPEAAKVAVPVPPNEMTARLGADACALDAAVHAWDVAVAIGRPSPLTPELARELKAAAVQFVEPLRAYGAYADAVPGEDGDPVADLLRYLGRSPSL
ncbi:hypothetical protein GCM10009678_43120 [Actinomadura kijaniata]|uniref:Uncharacterized protein (TIGR03086 family) n=1 Tax=Actinomadura namibiensis TaxID=182080 RepID=A0A7W3LU71_ACTNM|nr:TIGR03086 family metal-binding protein [Actinomadura namibiensis]MBA8954300.1 uncharacterized protein (TIGR03086 family) [Actinomadura namibiensis]